MSIGFSAPGIRLDAAKDLSSSFVCHCVMAVEGFSVALAARRDGLSFEVFVQCEFVVFAYSTIYVAGTDLRAYASVWICYCEWVSI